jgi:vesicle coat complex subunit
LNDASKLPKTNLLKNKCETSPDFAVIGDYCQNHHKFSYQSNNKQCTPNAVVALRALHVKYVDKWTTPDIHQILNVGDQLYLNVYLAHDQI